jgi:hypothetical protein
MRGSEDGTRRIQGESSQSGSRREFPSDDRGGYFSLTRGGIIKQLAYTACARLFAPLDLSRPQVVR